MKRINIAVTAKMESAILDYLVKFVPNFITPDILTLLALLSAFAGGFLYLYVENNPILLLVINLCLIIHWLTDSLDGRLARYRHIERPKYGYYTDHILDSLSAALIIGGLTTSNVTDTTAWVWVLSLMLISMIHAFLKNKVLKIFELSIQQLGPTEARIGLILVNLIIFIVGNPHFYILDIPFALFDIIGWIVLAGFLLVIIPEIIRTSINLAQKDKNEITVN